MVPSTVPNSRAYFHQRCNSETLVDGNDFEAVSDPLAKMSSTWCVKCGNHFPMGEFSWSDTGEKITDYYARHSIRASALERYVCSRDFLITMMVTSVVLGAIILGTLFRNLGEKGFLIGLAVVSLVGVASSVGLYFLIRRPIVRRICGVVDTRLLR